MLSGNRVAPLFAPRPSQITGSRTKAWQVWVLIFVLFLLTAGTIASLIWLASIRANAFKYTEFHPNNIVKAELPNRSFALMKSYEEGTPYLLWKDGAGVSKIWSPWPQRNGSTGGYYDNEIPPP